MILGHQPALRMADDLLFAKEALTHIAGHHGLVLSWHPKPLPAALPNGCHLHFSLEQVYHCCPWPAVQSSLWQ